MVNVKPVKLGNRERMSFGKINEVIDMPNLIDVKKYLRMCRELPIIKIILCLILLITLLMLITQITAL